MLKEDFDNPDYLLTKVDLLQRQNETTEARKSLAVAYNFVQDDPSALLRFSALAMRLGLNDDAIAALKLAREHEPKDLFITLQLAKIQIASGDTDAAQEIVSGLIEDGVDDANLWLTQGLLRAAQGNDELAVESYKRALTLAPEFSKPLVELYNYALSDRFVDEFLSFARDITNTQPDNLLAKNLLAQYLFFIREFDESSQLYRSLLSEDKALNKALVLTRLAQMKMESDLTTANRYVTEAFALAPNDATILDTYGWILSQQGQLEEGLSRLREAYARDANNPNIRYHLGYTLAKLGRKDEAKKELQYAVSVEQPFFRRPQAQALLNSLD